jgi:hypothetical protein
MGSLTGSEVSRQLRPRSAATARSKTNPQLCKNLLAFIRSLPDAGLPFDDLPQEADSATPSELAKR